jgi:hypothetical protein
MINWNDPPAHLRQPYEGDGVDPHWQREFNRKANREILIIFAAIALLAIVAIGWWWPNVVAWQAHGCDSGVFWVRAIFTKPGPFEFCQPY